MEWELPRQYMGQVVAVVGRVRLVEAIVSVGIEVGGIQR